MTRDFFSAGRSVVYSTEGMAATSHPIATINALRILESGGTAIDAAVTASAILGVLEPMETGLGGDCFALYSEKGKMPPIAFNGSGRSPKNANLDWFLKNEFKNINPSSVHAITIPGAVDAWWRLHQRFGRLEFGSLLLRASCLSR